MMTTDAETVAVMKRYARFARDDAPGRSELYARWAAGIAGDGDTAAILARIAASHRQPPLVFAVTRLLGAPMAGFREWARWLAANAAAVVSECGRRSIQTNDPLRCAALLPALSLIDGPIALLEVGASAGLCLYPDRYSYRYLEDGGEFARLDPPDGPSTVMLECDLRGLDRPGLRLPEIVWRAGIDLAPLDASDPDDRAWLTTLVWPGETGRAERIRAALDIVAADPPHLVSGDATDLLADVAVMAPAGATLVVTTPGVLVHVPRTVRTRIIDLAGAAGRWITLDAPDVHDAWHPPIKRSTWSADSFALAVDGVMVAAADPLGKFLEWRAGGGGSSG